MKAKEEEGLQRCREKPASRAALSLNGQAVPLWMSQEGLSELFLSIQGKH
jgi:hypothetical protein